MKPAVYFSGAAFRAMRAAAFVCIAWGAALSAGCVFFQESPSAALPEDLPPCWTVQASADQLPITSSLLDMTGDPQLRDLVQEALENNPDLLATALRLQAAGILLAGPRSRMLPNAGAEFTANRHNQDVNPETGKDRIGDVLRPALNVSWELDIWGRLADEYKASQSLVRVQEWEYLQLKDALAARVIQAWIQQAAFRQAVEVQEQRLAVLQKVEHFILDRYRKGLGALDELAAARSRCEIATADLADRNTALAGAVRNLEILLGRPPRGRLCSTADLPQVLSPAVDIPAAVLLKPARHQGCPCQGGGRPKLGISGAKSGFAEHKPFWPRFQGSLLPG